VYMQYSKENKASWKSDEVMANTLKSYFKGKKLRDITILLISKYINHRLVTKSKRGKLVSQTTIRKELYVLSMTLGMAIEARLVDYNPVKSLPKIIRKKIAKKVRRQRFLTLEEQERLFAQLRGKREHIVPIVQLALYTGMRRGEILNLKREYINFSDKPIVVEIDEESIEILPNWLLIHKTKTGKRRVIPMSGKVRAILESLCKEATCNEYVFMNTQTGDPIQDIKTGYVSACTDAKIINLTFHDLRHTWSTRTASMGVAKHVRRDILGHAPDSMTDQYTHATPEDMCKAMELVVDFETQNVITANLRQAS
jgi:integrase